MDGSLFGRLTSRTVVLPEQGEIEPVRLISAAARRTSDNSTVYDEEGRHQAGRTGQGERPGGSQRPSRQADVDEGRDPTASTDPAKAEEKREDAGPETRER